MRAVASGGALALLLVAGPAQALDPHKRVSQYTYRTWGEETGLPQPSVYAIAQTTEGYLWLGTEAGLARFDGETFTAVVPTDGIGSSNQVRAILIARDGAFWLGTRGGEGLLRFNGKTVGTTFESFRGRTGLASHGTLSAFEDSRGDLWLGGWRGVVRFSRGRFDAFSDKDGLPFGGVLAIAEAEDSTLWFATSTGVGRMRAGVFDTVRVEGLDGQRVTAILADGSGVWAGSSTGLYRLDGDDGGKVRRLGRGDGLPGDAVNVLFRDRDGNIWVGTDEGIARMRDGEIQALTPGAPNNDSFISAFEDREGNLWLGTRAGGLVRLSDGKFSTLTTAEGLPSNLTTAVLQTRDGALWIGTEGAGLIRFAEGRYKTITTADGLCTNLVISLFEGADGSLWVGGGTGGRSALCRLRKDGTIRSYTEADGMPRNEHGRVVYESPSGKTYVGTERVFVYENDRMVLLDHPRAHAKPGPNVFSLHEDRKGGLWVGLGNGLWHRKKGETAWKEYRTPAASLSAHLVYHISEDPDGTLWMGTSRGMTRYRDGVFRPYMATRGLFDHQVFHVHDDGAGLLWLATSRGVFRVRKQDFDEFDQGKLTAIPFTRFGIGDGMKTDQCSGMGPSGVVRARDGRLLFATSKGLATVDPNRLPINTVPPNVVVERVVADGHVLASGAAATPGTRSLEVHYTALSFTAPEKVRFKYRLEPFDRDWIDAEGRRTAYYTNLPPGSYRFRVVAANNDGVWNRQGALMAFALAPYFHETVFFRVLVVLGIGIIGWAIHKRRLAQVEARHVAVLAERTRIAREMHDTLAQGFTGISLHLEAAVKKLIAGAPDRAQWCLDQARLQVRASLAEARRAVWGLRSQVLDSGDLSTALSQVIDKLRGETPMRLSVSGEVRPLPENHEQTLVRVAQEALTNAVRHARASEISVELTYGPDVVELRVRDNGVGFDVDAQFPGHFGLVGIRERVAALGGELSVQSARGEGTLVAVRLPVPTATERPRAA